MSENGDIPINNGHKPKHRFTKIGPRFGREKPAIPGPGRPPIPDAIKEARRILKEAAPEMTARIFELSKHSDPDIAIKAIKVGLDKVLPNLEEVENFEHRPLQQLTDEQINAKLAELNARTPSAHSGNGVSAQ